jgi:hypothetical protein
MPHSASPSGVGPDLQRGRQSGEADQHRPCPQQTFLAVQTGHPLLPRTRLREPHHRERGRDTAGVHRPLATRIQPSAQREMRCPPTGNGACPAAQLPGPVSDTDSDDKRRGRWWGRERGCWGVLLTASPISFPPMSSADTRQGPSDAARGTPRPNTRNPELQPRSTVSLPATTRTSSDYLKQQSP